MYKYIYNHILEQKLLYKLQSGFVSGHSTFHHLIELYHKIGIALANGQITVAVLCDISKAFCRVWHKGLIEKIKSIGINGKLLQWLQYYISESCIKQLTFKGLLVIINSPNLILFCHFLQWASIYFFRALISNYITKYNEIRLQFPL